MANANVGLGGYRSKPKAVSKPKPKAVKRPSGSPGGPQQPKGKPAPKAIYRPPNSPGGPQDPGRKGVPVRTKVYVAPKPKYVAPKPKAKYVAPKATPKPKAKYVAPKATAPKKAAPKKAAPKVAPKAAPKAAAPKVYVQPKPKVVVQKPAVRDKYGTVGPTDNGQKNWNSNQSIPDYGAMTPAMIRQIMEGYSNPKQYDPSSDPVYTSMMDLARKQADAAGMDTMEDMNERGILNSTVTSDRVGQIKQGASDAVIGQIPGLSANFQNQNASNQAGAQALLNSVMGGAEFQQNFAEGNRRYDTTLDFDKDVFNQEMGYKNRTFDETLAFDKNVFGREQGFKERSFDQSLAFEKDSFGREMNYKEQNAKIDADLRSRGIDVDQFRAEIDQFNSQSDAEYKAYQREMGISDQQASANTNGAIGEALRAGSPSKALAFLSESASSWAKSGVDVREVIDAINDRWPETAASTGNSSSGSSTSDFFSNPSPKGGHQQVGSSSLGSLSARYESSGNPAVIARNKGDLGGASYGTYQLTTSSGHAQAFASNYGGLLGGKKAGSASFDQAWKAEAKKNPAKFKAAQHNYIAQKHYVPAANKFQSITGIKVSSMPNAVKDMIWSIGVQHGAGGAASVFKNAGIKAGMSAATIIQRVYTERMKVNKYFSSSPQSIKNGVLNRFRRELSDALKMLSR